MEDEISNKNKVLITSIREYIYKLFSITEEEFNKSTKKYIKELLKSIKTNNYKIKYLRLKREKLREDIKDIEASFVVGDSYDREFISRNTGLQPNTTEIKYLQRAKIKEELRKLVIETIDLEKALEKDNTMIQKFIELIPNEEYQIIMKMTYIDCMSNIEIAAELFYSVNTIDNARWRSIRELNKIIRE